MTAPEYTDDEKKLFRDFLNELATATNPKHKAEVKKQIKAAGFKLAKVTPENAPPLYRKMGVDLYIRENIVRDEPELAAKLLAGEALRKLKGAIAFDDLCRANGVSNALLEPTDDELTEPEEGQE